MGIGRLKSGCEWLRGTFYYYRRFIQIARLGRSGIQGYGSDLAEKRCQFTLEPYGHVSFATSDMSQFVKQDGGVGLDGSQFASFDDDL